MTDLYKIISAVATAEITKINTEQEFQQAHLLNFPV